jgi:hypothetical protein
MGGPLPGADFLADCRSIATVIIPIAERGVKEQLTPLPPGRAAAGFLPPADLGKPGGAAVKYPHLFQ